MKKENKKLVNKTMIVLLGICLLTVDIVRSNIKNTKTSILAYKEVIIDKLNDIDKDEDKSDK